MMCSESSILVHPIEEKDIFVSGQFYNMVSITGLSCGLARQRDVRQACSSHCLDL